jgi:hypothetical protein
MFPLQLDIHESHNVQIVPTTVRHFRQMNIYPDSFHQFRKMLREFFSVLINVRDRGISSVNLEQLINTIRGDQTLSIHTHNVKDQCSQPLILPFKQRFHACIIFIAYP